MAYADIPFRIRVGVTGHRTLPEPERVAAAIREAIGARIWELFDRRIPPRRRATPLAYTVATSLAEGADRLVAQEIIETPDAEIEAVLPLAEEDYLRDFATAESKAEFEELFRKARHISVLKPLSLDWVGPETEPEEERQRAYEGAGRHVVDRCDVLIAVWDGKPSRGRGGTAEIVAYARERKRPLILVSLENPEEIVIDKGPGLSGRAYARIGMFNRFRVPEARQLAYVNAMHGDLFAAGAGEELPGGVKIRVRERLLPWYVKASLMAKRNQKRYFRAGWIVYALSPLAVAAVCVGILAPRWALAAFISEFVFLLIIYLVIRAADRRKVHKQWMEARFLAERIRSAIFFFSCGAKPAPVSFPSFLKPAMRADEWIVRTFDEIRARAGDLGPEDLDSCADCAAFVRARWIEAQISYHAGKAEKTGQMSRLLEKAGRAVFLAAIGAAAWHLVSYLLGPRGILPALEKPAIFLALVLPALGTAIGGLRTHREYSRLEKRSLSMKAALRELDRRFAAVADFSELEALLRETERLTLQETQDWLTLMTFAKVEAV